MNSWEDWQKPYQFGTLVIWPPDALREIVNSQRERIDPVSGSYCEAHITVTQPLSGYLDDEEWDRLETILSSIVSFEISYGPLKTFLPYPCIWYEIQPAEKVLELRNVLHQTGFFNLDMKHPQNFIPHMTITEGLSGPEVDENLFRMLQEESGKGLFHCKGLSYIVPDEDFRFQVKRFLPLS
jgi:2'-5' RNA ligase